MDGLIIALVGLALLAVYTVFKRINAGTYKADENMFSQAGITVYFKERKIVIKGKNFEIDAITNIRTEPPLHNQTMAYDCVISLSDFSMPEHRIRFVNSTQANKFMQRLATAIERAGGPSFR